MSLLRVVAVKKRILVRFRVALRHVTNELHSQHSTVKGKRGDLRSYRIESMQPAEADQLTSQRFEQTKNSHSSLHQGSLKSFIGWIHTGDCAYHFPREGSMSKFRKLPRKWKETGRNLQNALRKENGCIDKG